MPAPRIIGRYALYGEIAAGGMATVHLGRLVGSGGVHRLVAIKRLHAQFAKDPEFVTMFLDEGRLSARIHHPNVVSVLDFLALEGELFLVMEYVQGEALSSLIKASRKLGQPVPTKIAAAIVIGLLQGLQAAHIATNERGEPLSIVHRDVSPQNVLVSVDGVARVLDFGVAKAAGRLQTTREGHIKGKIAYMAPEQLRSEPVTHRADVYGAAVVLYELLTGRRLYDGDNEGALLRQIVLGKIEPPSTHAPDLDRSWDAIVMKGLSSDPEERYASAEEMAEAIEAATPVATGRAVGQWVTSLLADSLAKRAQMVRSIEQSDGSESVKSGDAAALESMLTPGARAARALASAGSSEPPTAAVGLTPVARQPSGAFERAPVNETEHTARATSMSGPVNAAASTRSGASSNPRVAVAVAVVVSVAVAVVVLYTKSRGPDDAIASTGAPVATVTAESSTKPAASSVIEPTVEPAPASSASAAVSASASAQQAIATRPPTTQANKPTAGTQPPPVKTTAKNPNCQNPFVIDSHGDTHVKRECL